MVNWLHRSRWAFDVAFDEFGPAVKRAAKRRPLIVGPTTTTEEQR